MSTADEVAQTARNLAESGTGTDEGVKELLACCADKRVSVVMARRRFADELAESPDNSVASRALQLLDAVLERGTWA